jgi:hypothetical protein
LNTAVEHGSDWSSGDTCAAAYASDHRPVVVVVGDRASTPPTPASSFGWFWICLVIAVAWYVVMMVCVVQNTNVHKEVINRVGVEFVSMVRRAPSQPVVAHDTTGVNKQDLE